MDAEGKTMYDKKKKQQQNRADKRIGNKISKDNMALNNRTSALGKQKKKAASMLMGMIKKK